MFAEERPTLLPLPLEPFRYYQYGERTAHLDGCVEVEAAYYSAPPGWISRRVHVQWNDNQVRLLDPHTGQLLREHLRQQRGRHRIQENDRPQRTPLKTEQLLLRADLTGFHIGALCRVMHDAEGPVAVPRTLGVAALAKKYGVGSTDDACAIALEAGACTYRFVRRYLERNPQLPLSPRQIDPLIRQLTHYRELIENGGFRPGTWISKGWPSRPALRPLCRRSDRIPASPYPPHTCCYSTPFPLSTNKSRT